MITIKHVQCRCTLLLLLLCASTISANTTVVDGNPQEVTPSWATLRPKHLKSCAPEHEVWQNKPQYIETLFIIWKNCCPEAFREGQLPLAQPYTWQKLCDGNPQIKEASFTKDNPCSNITIGDVIKLPAECNQAWGSSRKAGPTNTSISDRNSGLCPGTVHVQQGDTLNAIVSKCCNISPTPEITMQDLVQKVCDLNPQIGGRDGGECNALEINDTISLPPECVMPEAADWQGWASGTTNKVCARPPGFDNEAELHDDAMKACSTSFGLNNLDDLQKWYNFLRCNCSLTFEVNCSRFDESTVRTSVYLVEPGSVAVGSQIETAGEGSGTIRTLEGQPSQCTSNVLKSILVHTQVPSY